MTDYWNDSSVTSHFSSPTGVWLACELYSSPSIAADSCAGKAVWLGMCAPQTCSTLLKPLYCQRHCEEEEKSAEDRGSVTHAAPPEMLLTSGQQGSQTRVCPMVWGLEWRLWLRETFSHFGQLFRVVVSVFSKYQQNFHFEPKFVFLNISEFFCILFFLLSVKLLNYWNSCTGHYGLAEGISG